MEGGQMAGFALVVIVSLGLALVGIISGISFLFWSGGKLANTLKETKYYETAKDGITPFLFIMTSVLILGYYKDNFYSSSWEGFLLNGDAGFMVIFFFLIGTVLLLQNILSRIIPINKNLIGLLLSGTLWYIAGIIYQNGSCERVMLGEAKISRIYCEFTFMSKQVLTIIIIFLVIAIVIGFFKGTLGNKVSKLK